MENMGSSDLSMLRESLANGRLCPDCGSAAERFYQFRKDQTTDGSIALESSHVLTRLEDDTASTGSGIGSSSQRSESDFGEVGNEGDVAPDKLSCKLSESLLHCEMATSLASDVVYAEGNSEVCLDVSDSIRSVQASSMEFGSYLGHGCFGHVYEAVFDGQRVAIKQFNESLKPFKEEIVNLSRCQHSHLVSTLGFCADDFAVVMELHSECLFHRLHVCGHGTLREHQVLSETASALSYLHRSKVCHGNLKSENVLLQGDTGAVKLCDFGVASICARSSHLQLREPKRRSLCYRAPELLRRRPSFTFESDVFAFAMLSWEVFSRKIPYAKRSGLKIEQHVEGGGREVIEEIVDSSIRVLIQQAWAQQPSKRPSMEHVVGELSRLWLEAVRQILPSEMAMLRSFGRS